MPIGHWITELINKFLGAPVVALLRVLGREPRDIRHPIPEYFATQLVVFVLLVLFALWLKRRLSVERPGAVQQCMEMLLTNPMGVGVRDLLDDMVGHGGSRHMAMLGTIGFFVLFCNLIGVIPGFASPTANAAVPLGCALTVFAYYNFCGVRKHGPLGYGKHFLGPSLPLAPLMLPIEIVSNLARLLSLTVRLWVNMLVSELLYVLFLGMTLGLLVAAKSASIFGYALAPAPLLIPLVFILLHIFVGFLQAFVFTLLPIIYVSGAVAEEH
jgi:F-type H+-transporting ATPase subunit a